MKKIGIQIFVTLIFGIFFTVNQLVEYLECDFSLSDSIYGSSFFITTGFHGLHVIVGRLFLL
jgi:cytochrome c oxidase subunit 3